MIEQKQIFRYMKKNKTFVMFIFLFYLFRVEEKQNKLQLYS